MNGNRIVLLLGVLVATLPSCGGLVDWTKDHFYQGEQLDKSSVEIARGYIRSKEIYNQFATCGLFDALWLCAPVRRCYADMHSARCGKKDDHRTLFLRRQLEENSHFISFYVLSAYETVLGEADSAWSLFLEVDGQNYQPVFVKQVDLPHEYQLIFGKHFNRFKVAYHVKFGTLSADERPVIRDTTQMIKLHFRSADKEAVLVWDVPHDNQQCA